jgi:N-acyl-D-aspartate/D-glutamate deacylase
MNSTYDIIIQNGRLFDGSGGPSSLQNIGIKDGVVTAISADLLECTEAEVLNAEGAWVTPGFIDAHTHYDAELLAAPGLNESVRHGVTTIITGSCSLSMIYCGPKDAADLFSRVEALPYDPMLKIVEREHDWSDPEGWAQTMNKRALGPNVASLMGHSDIRAHVMGLDRSTSGAKPTKEERQKMVACLEEALDAGFVGMSSQTNPWDKLAGDRFRSRCLPSAYASWKEYGWLHKVVRRRNRVLQSAPNLNTKVNMLGFFAASSGWFWRKPMKTTLISAADPKASSWVVPIFGPFTRLWNFLTRARFTWQAIPGPFEVYADGIDLVIFEEFGAGAEAMHLADEIERDKLLKTEGYRRRFRKDFDKKFSPRVWHRDFHDAHIVDCPDPSVVGKTVGAVAEERDIHVVDAFLDLVITHGKDFRWRTVIANHRPKVLKKMLKQSSVHIGFSDCGAHLRSMGFYNFPLQLLRLAKDAQGEARPFMSVERAVHRLTGEIADWYDLDAGRIELGARADISIVRPEALDETLDAYHEAPFPEMEVHRVVRRNDDAVVATVIGGKTAYTAGAFADDFGRRQYGRFLRSGLKQRESLPQRSLHQTSLEKSA